MKRLKATFTDIPEYFDFQRIQRADGLKGWRYLLDRPLTPEEREELPRRWRNLELSGARHRYAPEIRYDAVILWDKCVRKGAEA